MAGRLTVAALDVGTSKVLAAAATLEPGGAMRVTGVGFAPSRGLRRGAVVDLEATVDAVERAVDKAERMAGERIASVILGISGGQVVSANSRGVVVAEGGDIRSEDVQRVLDAARAVDTPADREVVHVIPHHFVVDGYEGVREPAGMAGTRLEVETHIVSCPAGVLHNAWRAVERAGLTVADMALNGLAAAESVLSPEERELGVAIADIGGGTTDLVVFRDGGPVFSAVLPYGGDLITSDLAIGLRTSLAQAEDLKVRHGVASAELADAAVSLAVPPIVRTVAAAPSAAGATGPLAAAVPAVAAAALGTRNGLGGAAAEEAAAAEVRHVSERVLAEIIEARLEEIVGALGEAIRQSGHAGSLPAGLVLTGGTARLRGIGPVTMRLLDLPARTGAAHDCGGMEDLLGSPSCAAAVGLLQLGAAHALVPGDRRVGASADGSRGIGHRLRAWLRELF